MEKKVVSKVPPFFINYRRGTCSSDKRVWLQIQYGGGKFDAVYKYNHHGRIEHKN